MKISKGLLKQSIERTKREIANPSEVWGAHGRTLKKFSGGRFDVSSATLSMEAQKRLEILMEMEDA